MYIAFFLHVYVPQKVARYKINEGFGSYTYILGRVENSKTFQNQMAKCFFIGLYDIETGDDFYFFQKKIFDGWKWILKKSIFTREKWLK